MNKRNAFEGRIAAAFSLPCIICAAALLASLCLLCVGCKSDPEAEADLAAEKAARNYLFDTNTDMATGLKRSRVFGREYMGFLTEYGFPNGAPAVTRESDGSRVVTISFWCAGVKPNGGDGKYSRTIRLQTVKGGPEQPASVVSSSVSAFGSADLSVWPQFFTWLLWSSIAPLCVWITAIFYGGGDFFENSRLGGLLARYTSTPLAAYLAYVCFGSWVAVGVFVVVHVGLTILYLRLLSAIIGAVTLPRHSYY